MTRRMAVAIRSLPIIFAFFAVSSNLLAVSSEVIITHAPVPAAIAKLPEADKLNRLRFLCGLRSAWTSSANTE